ncbi:hypothetical protein [Ralstonia syzygii]
MQQLFRRESMQAQAENLYGTIIVRQPWSWIIVSLLLTVWIAALLLFFRSYDFVRREAVSGLILPGRSVFRAATQASGGVIGSSASSGQSDETIFDVALNVPGQWLALIQPGLRTELELPVDALPRGSQGHAERYSGIIRTVDSATSSPLCVGEAPTYRLNVTVASTDPAPLLKTGQRVTALLTLEHRKLYQWLFDSMNRQSEHAE